MIWQSARVVERNADSLILSFGSTEVCERCARGEGCGAGNFARLFSRRATRVAIPARSTVVVGDRVRVGAEPRQLALAAVLYYGLPLAGFLLGALLAHGVMVNAAWRDPAALAGGIAGFVLVARLASTRVRPTWNPVVEHLSCRESDTNSALSD